MIFGYKRFTFAVALAGVWLAICLTVSVSGKVARPVQQPARVRIIGVRPQARVSARESSQPDEIGVPLIEVDEQMASYIDQAKEMISKKDYAQAIEILQALLNRPRQCFVPTKDSHRFVSLACEASEILSSLPAEAKAIYRRLYDPSARRLFTLAAERMDESILRDISLRYINTSYGDDALNLLGAILFDKGRFSQAAECWKKILRMRKDEPHDVSGDSSDAVLLSKISIALRLAGATDASDDAFKALLQRFPDAHAKLAGEDRNVVGYTRRLLEVCPVGEVLKGQRDWPCLAGAADSVAVMGSSEPVLVPSWQVPTVPLENNPNIRAAKARFVPGGARSSSLFSVRYREGRLCLIRKAGRGAREITVPPLIHPIVVGSTVLYRGADGISAHDLLTGQKLWQSVKFPLYNNLSVSSPPYRRNYFVRRVSRSGDDGLWTLTAGDGLVFAVGMFKPNGLSYPLVGRGRNGRVGLIDSSVLAAFSIAQQGRLVWKLGGGSGSTEEIRMGRFLTAPTYADGRVYVVVEHLQRFYLVCLDARTGNLVWSSMVSQMPVEFCRNRQIIVMPGNPPAVAYGRVFVSTNGGIIGAFDAQTGVALWAYQYKPELKHAYPFNPIVVTCGNVIALPADSERLIALRADDGELVWAVSRGELQHLAAVDPTRVVMTGGNGIVIVEAATGQTLWASQSVRGLHGRPAVSTDTILVSGTGVIVRVSLKDFSITCPPLLSPNGALGNLLSVDGKLLAADAAGISAYVSFEDAYKELTERISKASPDELPELLYHRAMNAFVSKRPEEALTDLLKARRMLAEKDAPVLHAKIQQLLYRTYVSLANRSSNRETMLKYFLNAQRYAYGDRSKGEMLVRLVKYYEKIGRADLAAIKAQELSDEYPEVELADRRIGPAADPFVHDNPGTPLYKGFDLGQRLIGQLIDEYGQGCYAALDTKARKRLEGAVAAGNIDAMVEVARRYPHSLYAPMALFRAAEACYRRSSELSGKERRSLLRRGGIYLYRIVREYPNSGLVPSAYLGLTLVYSRVNPSAMVVGLHGLEELPSNKEVSFAGVTGNVAAVMERIRNLKTITGPRAKRYLAGAINPPLKMLFSSPGDNRGEGAMVLRDAAGGAIRYGKDIFMIRAGEIIRFDPSAGSFDEGIKWETPRVIDSRGLFHGGYIPHNPQGGLTSDSSILAVATSGGLVGVDVKTGKVLWQEGRSTGYTFSLIVDEDRIVIITRRGHIEVWDAKTGNPLLQQRLPKGSSPWTIPPQVANGLLLVCSAKGSKRYVNVFDIDSGSMLLNLNFGLNLRSAYLSPEGLLLVRDTKSLQVIEPVLGVRLWGLELSYSSSSPVVGLSDGYLFISAADKPGTLIMRSIVRQGLIVRTFRLSPTGTKPSFPVAVTLVGHYVYVVASSTSRVSTWDREPLKGRTSSCYEPTLHAFDVNTGRELWSVGLVPPGAPAGRRRRYYLVMPILVGKSHISVLVKAPVPMRNPWASALLIDRSTGRVAQHVKVADAGGLSINRRYMRQMMLSSPVIADGRMIVETYKGVEIYGEVR